MLAQAQTIPTENGVATLVGLETVFGNVVGVLLGLAGIALFIMLVIGGFKYITAGGDPKGVESAKKTLTYAIGGMVLIAAGFLILQFIHQFTGVDITQFRIFQPQ
jgi:Ca2+/H+ antiporter